MARSIRAPRPTFATPILAMLAVALFPCPNTAMAQAASRDGIAELIARDNPPKGKKDAELAQNSASQNPEPVPDPRENDKSFQQARDLMRAIDSILRDTAEQRSDARKLPGKDEFIVPPLWTETREDRERQIRNLMDSALAIVTDVPVVDVQKRVEQLRRNIAELEDRIVSLKERQLTAPKDGVLPGVLSETVDSLADEIKTTEARIEKNKAEITAAKVEIHQALKASGIELGEDQIDLLLDSVLSGDLVRLVAIFNAAKIIDGQLAKMLTASGDNMNAARKYFAMHAALFAMLVHAQDSTIDRIDNTYMPKLDAIIKDIAAAKRKTRELMKADNRPDQERALRANRESQRIAEEAATAYRSYLQQQREQIARARSRATHDLRIADNTFETVEASFQLRSLMRDSAASFEAIQKLEAPTFDQIFKNEELRREFENLTRKLDSPTS
ncbi:conserved exported protein of unknown function [Candidatus Filomicrobium marinum]|uniref:Uncharacterized protein n=2 Tax=Filomicrobium TaxID=119044 RepID=A0A0D6JAP4_9HYPH|nr:MULTISPECIES: hypothetical protein [Filomicrobium]CFX02984.1 conserved exported protein of unknown function [Candidatus Filomicrobium marinum]CPR15758.1 conserved exported protein of unknown function [Candidatus Filomicrobium marinum]SDP38656.1 hypothetical protein SAMN04488061_2802 [Filomicrobium insigne]